MRSAWKMDQEVADWCLSFIDLTNVSWEKVHSVQIFKMYFNTLPKICPSKEKREKLLYQANNFIKAFCWLKTTKWALRKDKNTGTWFYKFSWKKRKEKEKVNAACFYPSLFLRLFYWNGTKLLFLFSFPLFYEIYLNWMEIEMDGFFNKWYWHN